MTPEQIAREAAEAAVRLADKGKVHIGEFVCHTLSDVSAENCRNILVRDLSAAVLAAIQKALTHCPVPAGMSDERLDEIVGWADEAASAQRLQYPYRADETGWRYTTTEGNAAGFYEEGRPILLVPADGHNVYSAINSAARALSELIAHVRHLHRVMNGPESEAIAAAYEAGRRKGREEASS